MSTYVVSLLVVVGSIAAVAYIALRDVAQSATHDAPEQDGAPGPGPLDAVPATEAQPEDEPAVEAPAPPAPVDGAPRPGGNGHVTIVPLAGPPVVSPPVVVGRRPPPAPSPARAPEPVTVDPAATVPLPVAAVVMPVVPTADVAVEDVRGPHRSRSVVALIGLWAALGTLAAGAVGAAVLLLGLALRRAAGVE